MIYRLPSPDDDPTPPAPALPPLLDVTCPTCLGDAWVEDHTTGYRCPDCGGSGYGPTVCSGCLQVPTVDTAGLERCGCNTERCEYVGDDLAPCPNAAEIDGLCRACWQSGWEALEREDPEHPALHEEVVWALRNTRWLEAVA